jgi:hypothetical protein
MASCFGHRVEIQDRVSRSHPEWIQPKAKGFIPDLTDVGDLMWIDAELARPKISSARRAALKALQTKALAGKLTRSEANKNCMA